MVRVALTLGTKFFPRPRSLLETHFTHDQNTGWQAARKLAKFREYILKHGLARSVEKAEPR